MKIFDFLEEKIALILFLTSFMLVLSLFLIALKIDVLIVCLFNLFFFLGSFLFLCFEYVSLVNKNKKIEQLITNLEEKYLIAEVLPKSKNLENQAYVKAIKLACKAMNDKISALEEAKKEYQEYIESFVHEIKTPIAALSLVYDNEKNYELKQEVQKIDKLIEQILFYARSDVTAHDYFIRRISITDLVHHVLIFYKDYLLHQKIMLKVHDLENIVYTDEKWLTFILSQIIQNAIKYSDTLKNEIEIYSINNAHSIVLTILDHGCGIKPSDLKRVFEKGFTGSNRKKKNATGMGLYLSKKLADHLGLKIQISSKEKQYTKVEIIFPKTNLYQSGMN
jgi:signal transduction histidine kinase